jgi:hypothetical protein
VASRARVLARSPGSLVYCNIHFAGISIEIVHLYVTEFHICNLKLYNEPCVRNPSGIRAEFDCRWPTEAGAKSPHCPSH